MVHVPPCRPDRVILSPPYTPAIAQEKKFFLPSNQSLSKTGGSYVRPDQRRKNRHQENQIGEI